MGRLPPLFDLNDGVVKGKGFTAILNSKVGHARIVGLFGGPENVPSSIMKTNKHYSDDDEEAPAKERGYNATCGLAKKRKGGMAGYKQGNNLIDDAYYISMRGAGQGALSNFPQNVGRSMLLLYSDPGAVVVDPFAGHNSRMELCVRNGRHYIGSDLSHEFMEYNRKRAKKLRKEFGWAKIGLHEGDSRKLPIEDGVGDFSITSPPYWDIEYYGDEAEQLGKSKTYKEFLDGIGQVMKEVYRCLKPGAYSCWFINDFRKNGKMHFYHMDVTRLGRKAGFIAQDIVVVDLGRSMRDCFLNQMVQTRIIPKRHEYCMVFRKPL